MAPPADPAAAPASPAPSPSTVRLWRWLRALRSPTRELIVGSLVLPIAAAAISPVRVWFLDLVGLGPGPSGSLAILVGGGMTPAEFARIGGPASTDQTDGLHFQLRLDAHHTSRCSLTWTLVNDADRNQVPGWIDRPVTRTTKDTRNCPTTTDVWVPLPRCPPEHVSAQLQLIGDGKSLRIVRSESFTQGGMLPQRCG